jgi:uncharacterized membrane protein YgcG
MRRRLALVLLILLGLAAAPLAAEERILAYDIELDVAAEGSLDVTERIRVRAEGNRIRRGIYRDFPTRYRDRHGNRVVVGFEVLGVERDGRPEPWFTERMRNGIRINTGDDRLLPAPSEPIFTLRYRTTRQLGFFGEHDELYWNAIGTGWAFKIERGTVEARLPDEVPTAAMNAEAYTGFQGERGQSYAAELPAPGRAHWRLTQPLAPGQGLTVVLTFPKGVVTAPTRAQRIRWLLADNRGILIALAGLAALLVFCARRWWRLGRDPRAGVIFPRYEPPAERTPAALRFLRRMGYDTRCFTADLLALAVGGQVRIGREKKLFRDAWQLDRLAAETAVEPAAERSSRRALLDGLFGGARTTLRLEKSASTAQVLQRAQQAHRKALDGELHGRYFRRNRGSVGLAALIAVGSLVLAFALAGGGGIPAILAVAALMALLLVVFARLVRAPTPEGRALLDEIEGLRLYLSVAERDELAGLEGPGAPPPLDAARYEALLPYAVALEVEEAWTRKFTLAVGAAAAAAAAASISWYRGGSVSDLGSLSRSIGSGLSSQIASSSSPPGSSSGSGGGGSSGGGGGGGGGGGR